MTNRHVLTAFADVHLSDFPVTIEVYSCFTGEALCSLTAIEPGAIRIPLTRFSGPVGLRLITTSGQVRVAQ